MRFKVKNRTLCFCAFSMEPSTGDDLYVGVLINVVIIRGALILSVKTKKNNKKSWRGESNMLSLHGHQTPA